MWKLIFLALIIWLAIYLIRQSFKSNQSTTGNQPESETKHSDTEESDTENMVQCETCHIHLPRSEAFMANKKFYCSTQHMQQDAP
ncbi:MAG: PP0621 family protein [Methylotenera sp.]|jgi:ABC-type nickel/cobalt efflux system permease component RcnA|nr:PP0621 family protein [Methylotenera sp.]